MGDGARRVDPRGGQGREARVPLAAAPGGLENLFAKLSEAERRREEAEGLFEIEETALEFGFPSELVHDAEADVFRFPDGRFALSRERADWPRLKETGYFSAWGM